MLHREDRRPFKIAKSVEMRLDPTSVGELLRRVSLRRHDPRVTIDTAAPYVPPRWFHEIRLAEDTRWGPLEARFELGERGITAATLPDLLAYRQSVTLSRFYPCFLALGSPIDLSDEVRYPCLDVDGRVWDLNAVLLDGLISASVTLLGVSSGPITLP